MVAVGCSRVPPTAMKYYCKVLWGSLGKTCVLRRDNHLWHICKIDAMFCCNRCCPNKAAVPLCYTPYKHHSRHQTSLDDNDEGANGHHPQADDLNHLLQKKPLVSGGGRKEGNTFHFTLQVMHQSIFFSKNRRTLFRS